MYQMRSGNLKLFVQSTKNKKKIRGKYRKGRKIGKNKRKKRKNKRRKRRKMQKNKVEPQIIIRVILPFLQI